MTAIEKYVEAMENKDYAGLANLFSPDGIINDYCTNSAAQNEYHIYGREAINMFFRNMRDAVWRTASRNVIPSPAGRKPPPAI